jgi:hypothetical protein
VADDAGEGEVVVGEGVVLEDMAITGPGIDVERFKSMFRGQVVD